MFLGAYQNAEIEIAKEKQYRECLFNETCFWKLDPQKNYVYYKVIYYGVDYGDGVVILGDGYSDNPIYATDEQKSLVKSGAVPDYGQWVLEIREKNRRMRAEKSKKIKDANKQEKE